MIKISKLTSSKESSVRKKIDQMLENLGWNIDEEVPECNVFTERPRTQEEKEKLEGKPPDFVLYDSETKEPIAIIEAKRKGQDLGDAIEQAEEKYAKPLGVNIIFAYDGTFFKSWHVEEEHELEIDGEAVTGLLPERKVKRFKENGHSISDITPVVEHTRAELINVFKWANNLLREEGLREGIERFTEFSNLLFLKLISEIEEKREESEGGRVLEKEYCWESFKDLEPKKMMNYINNTVLPRLVGEYNHSGDVFEEELSIKDPKTLVEIVERLSELNLSSADTDVKGDAFEYFLKSSVSVGNDLGEYFTPRHLVKLMVQLIGPKFGERIYDPTCGTGGFLIQSFYHLKERCKNTEENLDKLREETVYGRELTNTAKIAKMNMILTGDGHTNIKQMDTLANPVEEKYDVVLANPPYGQTTKYGEYYPIPSNDGDAVFIQHIYKSLKNGGRAAVVIPQGLLFRMGDDYKVRKFLLENTDIKAIISLPPGVFRPYAKGNKTNIIIFEKDDNGTDSIWFYKLTADGYDLDSDMRRPVENNDIPDLLEKWSEKPQSKKSWNVNIDEIKENDYELMAKTYEPTETLDKDRAKFSDFLEQSKEKVEIEDDKTYKQITVKLYGKGAVLRDKKRGERIETKKQYKAKEGDLIVSKIDARNGALAIVPEELDGAVVTSDFPLFKVDTDIINLDFLRYSLRYGNWDDILERSAKGTTNRRRVKPSDVLDLEVPLPPMEEQEEIAERLEIQHNIIQKSELTLSSLKKGLVDKTDFSGDYPGKTLEEVCENIHSGGTPSREKHEYFKGDIPWVKISDYEELEIVKDTEEKITEEALKNSSAKIFPKDTVLVSIFATVGLVGKLDIEACTNQAIVGLVPDTDKVTSDYLMYYMSTLRPYYQRRGRGSNQDNINHSNLSPL